MVDQEEPEEAQSGKQGHRGKRGEGSRKPHRLPLQFGMTLTALGLCPHFSSLPAELADWGLQAEGHPSRGRSQAPSLFR